MSDSTTRFSDRVDAYIKYRPSYPTALLSSLKQLAQLDSNSTIADIGSGTGIFTRLLLDLELQVYGIEPNSNMRSAAQQILVDYHRFSSIDAAAESTGLEPSSVDLITVAQAFHWFNNDETKAEFRRILKANGKLALIWNKRKLGHPFQQAYDAVLREFAPEYGKVNHMNLSVEDIASLFSPSSLQLSQFDNSQQLEFSALLGRLKSSSYCPDEKSPQYIPLVNELLELFDQHAADGKVNFEYETQLYLGSIAS